MKYKEPSVQLGDSQSLTGVGQHYCVLLMSVARFAILQENQLTCLR